METEDSARKEKAPSSTAKRSGSCEEDMERERRRIEEAYTRSTKRFSSYTDVERNERLQREKKRRRDLFAEARKGNPEVTKPVDMCYSVRDTLEDTLYIYESGCAWWGVHGNPHCDHGDFALNAG